MPVDRVEPRQQLRERDALLARQVAAVGVDVLAEQRHLAHAVGGEPLHLVRRARPADG